MGGPWWRGLRTCRSASNSRSANPVSLALTHSRLSVADAGCPLLQEAERLAKNNESPVTRDLDKDQTILEGIEQIALEDAHRYAPNLTRIRAMARAIARGDVLRTGIEALAATSPQLSERCGCEVRECIHVLQVMRHARQQATEPHDDEGSLFPVDVVSFVVH